MPTWFIYALLSAIFAGLVAIFAKVGLRNIDSDLAMAIRVSFILIITWGIVYFRGKSAGINTLSKSNWIFLILSAIATSLSWLFYYHALQMGKVAQVSAIDNSSLVFAVLFSFIFLREVITLQTLIGVGLILGGMFVIWKSKS
jgi:bacterial/archaeal transporter family protein